MRVGSLVRNRTSHTMGIVFRLWRNDAGIHWIKSGNFTICSKISNNLEVICE